MTARPLTFGDALFLLLLGMAILGRIGWWAPIACILAAAMIAGLEATRR